MRAKLRRMSPRRQKKTILKEIKAIIADTLRNDFGGKKLTEVTPGEISASILRAIDSYPPYVTVKRDPDDPNRLLMSTFSPMTLPASCKEIDSRHLLPPELRD